VKSSQATDDRLYLLPHLFVLMIIRFYDIEQTCLLRSNKICDDVTLREVTFFAFM